MGGELVLVGVSRVHADGTVALAPLDLTVAPGEILALVGPSGAGKSTLLRLIAGVEPATTGTIRIGDRRLDDLAPAERDVGFAGGPEFVFPHLSAEANLRFPLQMRKVPEPEATERVGAEARVLQLVELLHRRPATLSAGELQRVAIGKATVRAPAAFLLDEPLHHLDAGQRWRFATDIAALLHGLGVPSIVVTHDARLAMVMGDRIAVLDRGRLHQVGTARQLYARPATIAVATCLGERPMALVPVTLTPGALVVGGVELPFPGANGEALRARWGERLLAGVRPDHFEVVDAGPHRLRARVVGIEHTGGAVVATATLGGAGGQLDVRLGRSAWPRPGDDVHLRLDTGRVSLFDPTTGLALWPPAP